jgi:hypothetical protein
VRKVIRDLAKTFNWGSAECAHKRIKKFFEKGILDVDETGQIFYPEILQDVDECVRNQKAGKARQGLGGDRCGDQFGAPETESEPEKEKKRIGHRSALGGTSGRVTAADVARVREEIIARLKTMDVTASDEILRLAEDYSEADVNDALDRLEDAFQSPKFTEAPVEYLRGCLRTRPKRKPENSLGHISEHFKASSYRR